METDGLNSKIPPMYRNRFLAHSLGGYKGFRYLNCEEGLMNAILDGFCYFEVDLMLTEDGKIVCTHGWDEENCKKTGMAYKPEFEHMTAELFLEQKVHGFTTMDIKRLYQYMLMYPQYYWELDLHTLPKEKAIRMAQGILDAFEHNEEVLGRCLVQVNTKGMYKAIDGVYHFKYYQYNIKNSVEKLDEFIEFSVQNNICAMAMKSIFATKENIEKVRSAGLALLVFSVDNYPEAQKYLKWGANTICTNALKPLRAEERMVDARLVYNSAPKAKERISELLEKNILRGTLARTKGMSYEYTEDIVFDRDGSYTLMENPFSMGFRKFLGWEIRRRDENGQWEWYGEDKSWHNEKKASAVPYERYHIPDKGKIEREMLTEERKLFLVAVWNGKGGK